MQRSGIQPASIALALTVAAGCRGAAPAGGAMPAMAVAIEAARDVTVDDTTEYVAQLRSRSSATIMPQVEGQVTKILVRAGERVGAGAPLVQIDAAKQQATLASQQDTRAARAAALALARQQFERVSGLHAQGISSQQDLDQAKAAVDTAAADLQATESAVREQQEELRYYTISAPSAGVVGDIPVRVGDRVTNQTLLTTVDAPGDLEAYISVPVDRAARLRTGMPVRIVDAGGSVLAETKVSFVSPQVDDQTQTVLAKAPMPTSSSARPSQSVRARIVWGTHVGPVVPVLAVSRISGQYFAYVATPEKGGLVARQRPLKLGEITGNDYVVLDGLAVGDRVIVSGIQSLHDGASVTPKG